MSCPVTHTSVVSSAPVRELAPPVDPDAVKTFLWQYHEETMPMVDPAPRMREALDQVTAIGTYTHTSGELEWACRVAWRNADKCVGRAGWASLAVRDRRSVRTAAGIAAETFAHADWSTNGGKIRPAVTVFAAAGPGRAGPRILNPQIIRYADDPAQQSVRDTALGLGWVPSGRRWEKLPLLVDADDGSGIAVFSVPDQVVLEVRLTHPEHPWFADLGLRWHALPAITDMRLEAGGLWYGATPFGGWYMETEIATRNLADPERLDMLPTIARGMGLDVTARWLDWRDRAAIMLNEAVLWSFHSAGVKVSDHRTESARFLAFLARERAAGRGHLEAVDWSWVVPASAYPTPVYHCYYQEQSEVPLPRLVRNR